MKTLILKLLSLLGIVYIMLDKKNYKIEEILTIEKDDIVIIIVISLIIIYLIIEWFYIKSKYIKVGTMVLMSPFYGIQYKLVKNMVDKEEYVINSYIIKIKNIFTKEELKEIVKGIYEEEKLVITANKLEEIVDKARSSKEAAIKIAKESCKEIEKAEVTGIINYIQNNIGTIIIGGLCIFIVVEIGMYVVTGNNITTRIIDGRIENKLEKYIEKGEIKKEVGELKTEVKLEITEVKSKVEAIGEKVEEWEKVTEKLVTAGKNNEELLTIMNKQVIEYIGFKEKVMKELKRQVIMLEEHKEQIKEVIKGVKGNEIGLKSFTGTLIKTEESIKRFIEWHSLTVDNSASTLSELLPVIKKIVEIGELEEELKIVEELLARYRPIEE